MTINLYAVKDVKVGFMNTWGEVNDAAAKRDFGDAINNSQSTLNKHPHDMQLFKVGTWNDQTGELTSKVEYLASGTDYYKEDNNNGVYTIREQNTTNVQQTNN